MPKLKSKLFAALLLLMPLGAARAQTTPGTTTGTNQLGVTKADFNAFRYQFQDASGKWVDMNKTIFETYFNRGNCLCKRPIRVIITLQSASRTKVPVGRMASFQLRAGDSSCVCQDATACTNRTLCRDLSPVLDQSALTNEGLYFETNVQDLFAAGRADVREATVCDRDEMQSLYLYGDSDDGGDFSDLTDVTESVRIDGLGPAAPTGLKVVGGNEALEVSWDRPTSVTDQQGYQVLCARGNGAGGVTPVFNSPGKTVFSAAFVGAGSACTTAAKALTVAEDAAAPVAEARDLALSSSDGGTETLTADRTEQSAQAITQSGAPPEQLVNLDPLYVCSNLLTSGNSLRVRGLQNLIPYPVAVVAIDKRGNPSKVTEAVLTNPIPTRDFYSGYLAAGGEADGGCTVAGGRGGSAAGWLGGALGLLALGRRARRRAMREGQEAGR
jgi:hypothetical protein